MTFVTMKASVGFYIPAVSIQKEKHGVSFLTSKICPLSCEGPVWWTYTTSHKYIRNTSGSQFLCGFYFTLCSTNRFFRQKFCILFRQTNCFFSAIHLDTHTWMHVGLFIIVSFFAGSGQG